MVMPKDIASEAPRQVGRHRGSQAGHRSKSAAECRRGPTTHAAGQLGLGGSSLRCLTSASCQRSAKSSPHVRLPAPCKVRQLFVAASSAVLTAHHRKKGLPEPVPRRFRDLFLIPENGTYRPRPREGLGRNPELGRPPILRVCAGLPDTANLRGKYFCGAAIQSASYY